MVASDEREAGMGDADRWFRYVGGKGPAAIGGTWIQRAVEQKHPKLALGLAHSIPLIYGELDEVLLGQERLN